MQNSRGVVTTMSNGACSARVADPQPAAALRLRGRLFDLRGGAIQTGFVESAWLKCCDKETNLVSR